MGENSNERGFSDIPRLRPLRGSFPLEAFVFLSSRKAVHPD
jgi:hypothetical protein